MMYGSRPPINPACELARHRMELVPNIHLMNLAIVMGKDEVHLLEFEDADLERMLFMTIPTFVRDTEAIGTILSSPDRSGGRDGALVALMERTLETYYVPIVRITNAQTLIGDFRRIDALDPNRFGPILEELVANWIKRER